MNNNIEHVVHANPPRVLGSDPMTTVMDSLVIMADKQRTLNTHALHAMEHKKIVEVMKDVK